MKSHTILILAIVVFALYFIKNHFIFLLKLVSCALLGLGLIYYFTGYTENQTVVRNQLQEIQEKCGKHEPPIITHKVCDGKEKVYVFGECENKPDPLKSKRNPAKKNSATLKMKIPAITKSRKFFKKASHTRSEIAIQHSLSEPRKVRATIVQKELISYTWNDTACHNDEQFITMIEGESRWNPWAVEKLDDGSSGDGIGACQVDRRHWPKIHGSKRFRTDPKYQIRVCCQLWRQGVRFYGHDRNDDMIARFWWPTHEKI